MFGFLIDRREQDTSLKYVQIIRMKNKKGNNNQSAG